MAKLLIKRVVVLEKVGKMSPSKGFFYPYVLSFVSTINSIQI